MASAAQAEDAVFAQPLPPTWALDEASRQAGFKEWFDVPAFLQTPTNRAIIVQARLIERAGKTLLSAECRERASYLKAMEPEGLSAIERQSMETLYKAADEIERLAGIIAATTGKRQP